MESGVFDAVNVMLSGELNAAVCLFVLSLFRVTGTGRSSTVEASDEFTE
jgi:hypothetical protein